MTVDPSPHLAPGCFGSAMTFAKAAPECASCPFASQCEPMSLQRLDALRTKLGVKVRAPRPPGPKPEKPVVREPGGQLVEVNQKALEFLQRFDTTELKVAAALLKGVNPFAASAKPRFLFLACALALKFPAGVSRDVMRKVFAKDLGCGERAASTYVNVAFGVLKAVGAGDERDGVLVLRRGQ